MKVSYLRKVTVITGIFLLTVVACGQRPSSPEEAAALRELQGMFADGGTVAPQSEKILEKLVDASSNGWLTVVRYGLDHGVDPNSKTAKGMTLLTSAAASGRYDIAKDLVDRGADVNCRGEEIATPIHGAAHKGDYAVVKLLLDHKAEVNAKAEGGTTPLMLAAQAGHAKVVSLLVERGAAIDERHNNGLNALLLAELNGCAEVVAILKSKGADVSLLLEAELLQAAGDGDVQRVNRLLKEGANPNITPLPTGNTALMRAARGGHVEVVRTLLEAGADPTSPKIVAQLALELLKRAKETPPYLRDPSLNPFLRGDSSLKEAMDSGVTVEAYQEIIRLLEEAEGKKSAQK